MRVADDKTDIEIITEGEFILVEEELMRVKVIYLKATDDGFNPGDSAMLEPARAKIVVNRGDAYHEKAVEGKPPKPKAKPKAKPKK